MTTDPIRNRTRELGKPFTADEAKRLAEIEAAPDAEESLRERVARAMRMTRECQAGMAFGVPLDARDLFMRALADAAIAVLRTPTHRPYSNRLLDGAQFCVEDGEPWPCLAVRGDS